MLAETTEHFELLAAPRGAPDDLTKLHGAGPQIVQKLNDAGIYHYWQIAAMTPEDVAKVDADLKLNGRIDRDVGLAGPRLRRGRRGGLIHRGVAAALSSGRRGSGIPRPGRSPARRASRHPDRRKGPPWPTSPPRW